MGCTELIASSLDQYVEIAVNLANDRPRIEQYKRTLRDKLMKCMNRHKFIQEYEDLLGHVMDKVGCLTCPWA